MSKNKTIFTLTQSFQNEEEESDHQIEINSLGELQQTNKLKSISKLVLQLARFRLFYAQITQDMQLLKNEHAQMKKQNQSLLKAKVDLESANQALRLQNTHLKERLQQNKHILATDQLKQEIKASEKNSPFLQIPSNIRQQLKNLSKACLQFSQYRLRHGNCQQVIQNLRDQLSSFELIQQDWQKRRQHQRLLKQKLMNMDQLASQFESKYQKKSSELNQLRIEFISLQERNNELMKQLEQKESSKFFSSMTEY